LKIYILLKSNPFCLDNKKDYINTILEKKIEQNKNEFYEQFEEMCYFLYKNKLFLSKILFMLNEFLSVIPNFNDDFITFYSQNNKNEDVISKIFETFLCCISDDNKFSFYFDQNKKIKYVELLQKNQDELVSISKENNKNSIFMPNIEIFLLIIRKEKSNDVLLKNVIKFLSKEKENNLEKQYEIKEGNFEDKVFLNFLMKQYQKNKNNLEIMDIFLSKKEYFKYSLFFFKSIFGEEIKKDANEFLFLDVSQYLKDKINNILSNDSNDLNNLFMENLLYYFECFYEKNYFKKFKAEKDKKTKYNKILNERFLELTKDYLKGIDDINKNNNKYNLEYLYKIAFIKIYFKYFVDFMHESQNGNELFDFNKLIEENFKLRLDIITEIKNNLKLKFENNYDFEKFIGNKGIKYLEKDNINIIKNTLEKSAELNKKEMKSNELKIPNITNYTPSTEILKDIFNINTSYENNKKKYPILNQFLNNKIELEYLKYLPTINIISNLMLDAYSYKKLLKN